jgi:hypothetical protein
VVPAGSYKGSFEGELDDFRKIVEREASGEPASR